MPSGGSLAFHGGGWTVTLSSTATRVIFTWEPSIEYTQIGTLAGPRDVSTSPVASWASVTSSDRQASQGALAALISAWSVADADMTLTSIVVPSSQRALSRAGVSVGSAAAARTLPAMSASLLLSPSAAPQSPIWPVRSPTK